MLKKPMREHKHATKLFLAARSDGMGKACQWCIEYLRNPQLMTRFVFN
ncbi:transcriptional regulator, LysR family domain protein [Escherichia coli DEC1A]|nr:transcriptional regulator, LysR family domain protein [Escherichia coli DEC1A]